MDEKALPIEAPPPPEIRALLQVRLFDGREGIQLLNSGCCYPHGSGRVLVDQVRGFVVNGLKVREHFKRRPRAEMEQ